MRKTVIAGNWKMHKNSDEAGEFVRDTWKALGQTQPKCEIVVAPSFIAIPATVHASKGTPIQVAGQNIHWEDKGAFTGEVSAGMLKDAGCTHVIIGHSERREYFGETDNSVNKKLHSALKNDLTPIFCVGEKLAEREADQTFEVIGSQLKEGVKDLELTSSSRIMIAYEPVWAIGTGKTATPEQAQEVHKFIRQELSQIVSEDFSQVVRILYGGSVKPDNIKGLMDCDDIDGALIGGASLKWKDFVGIITASS